MSDRKSAGEPTDGPRSAGVAGRADDGVDVTLIRWMLTLSPLERLQVLQRTIRSLERLRSGRTGR
ncbi:MAG: hypothetical protein IPK72_05115 [Candidatus Eisenbacteria bacterium]|nr:hypothetical protein [Candidatus Eisenbacteria bacterium]